LIGVGSGESLPNSSSHPQEVTVSGFIQIMEMHTSKIDEVEALARKMQEERGDGNLATRATVTQDREKPGRYLVLVEFASYEEAMKNSNDPITSRYSEKMGALLDSPPQFQNLDVVSVM